MHLCGRHHFYRKFKLDNGIKAYSNADEVELFVNGISRGIKRNGEYIQPDSYKKLDGRDQLVEGIRIDNVFFWKTPLSPGRNVVTVNDSRGNAATMIIYQVSNGTAPVPPDSLVVNLRSSNKYNPALFIDRAVEPQGPFYSEVDGSSDNTFDALPKSVESAAWIATKRLSDEKNKTDLAFQVTKQAIIYVMYSTGQFPVHTLIDTDESMMNNAKALKLNLNEVGFHDTGIQTVWRQHDLWLVNCELMKRDVKPGEEIVIKGHTLDYVVLIKPNQN